MWAAILGIASGLIGITALILKQYYKNKGLDPYKRRLKYVNNLAEKREAERDADLIKSDFLDLARHDSDIADSLHRLREQEKLDNDNS